MGFKEDADFARFVSVGAIGTAHVADYLKNQFGHRPVELERYAMANKVWQTKVKRLRLPDLVCVRCGLRVESRAKSKLKVILSHSDKPDRGWDSGGMRGDDLFAFLIADISSDPPHCGTPAFFSTEALRASISQAKRSSPKAVSEGSEVTLTWPCWVPANPGRFMGVDDQGRIVYERFDVKTHRYWQWQNWADPKYVYARSGESFDGDDKMLAGVVEPAAGLNCTGDTWDLAAALRSHEVVERYAAVKAIGLSDRLEFSTDLSAISRDVSVDWRIRLEAMLALARLEPEYWVMRLSAEVTSDTNAVDHQMEAVLGLSELPSQEAADSLTEIALRADLPSELRAAAAWGLGQGKLPRPEPLLTLMTDTDKTVALHAIAAVDRLTDDMIAELIQWLSVSGGDKAPAAARLLQRHDCVVPLLDACEIGGSARLWVLRALGELPLAKVRLLAGSRLTPDVENILRPMWLGQDDWLWRDGTEGLDALDVQKTRFPPSLVG